MSFVRRRIVFDTSSLVPICLHPEREPAQIFRRAVLEHEVFASDETLSELMAVVARAKFDAWRPLEQRLVWASLYREVVTVVKTNTVITECPDPKDNKFLELALAASADMLVSSDEHLLKMHPFRGVAIVQLAELKASFLDAQ